MFDCLNGHYRTDKNTGHSYGPVYEELLEARRETVTKVLEIGVFLGDSLRMWRDYFPHAQIIGLDINPKRQLNEDRICSIVGSQNDPATLHQVGALGPYDLIVDDGSHKASDQLTSLLYLWEFVKPGGVYVIEDLQEPQKWIDLAPCAVVDLRANKGIYDDALVVLERK